MISYNRFQQKLEEELSPEQRKKVSMWMRGISHKAATKISEDAMGGEHTIYLPLEHPETHSGHDEIDDEIAYHLGKHGYSIASPQDYRAGMAVDKHNRMVRIGKTLQKTGATPQLQNKFANDPKRAIKKDDMTKGLRVAITNEPYHVAAMSTGRGWSSCMDLDGGQYNQHIEHDLRHGTHVAYLIHENDKKIENPVARIALKKFHKNDPKSYGGGEIDKKNPHTILRAEHITYGSDTSDSAFSHTVKKWTDTHFPMQEGASYEKNKNLYDDSYRDIAMPSHESLKKALLSDSENSSSLSRIFNFAQGEGNLHQKAYTLANELKVPRSTLRHIVNHSGAPAHLVNHYVENGLKENDKQEFSTMETRRLSHEAINKLSSHNVSQLLDNTPLEHTDVHRQFFIHPGFQDRHISRTLENTTERDAIFNKVHAYKIEPHHISKAIDLESKSTEPMGMSYGTIRSLPIQPEHSKQIANSFSHDTEAGRRWLTYGIRGKHLDIDTVRKVVHEAPMDQMHIGDRSHIWGHLISHPDVQKSDIDHFNGVASKMKSEGKDEPRPFMVSPQHRNDFFGQVKDPEVIGHAISNPEFASEASRMLKVDHLLGDAMRKHHAAGSKVPTEVFGNHWIDFSHSLNEMGSEHMPLAMHILSHKYEKPANVPGYHLGDDTNYNLGVFNKKSKLILSMVSSKRLSQEDHNKLLDQAVKNKEAYAEKTPEFSDSGDTDLSKAIAKSGTTKGKIHPRFRDMLNRYDRDTLEAQEHPVKYEE